MLDQTQGQDWYKVKSQSIILPGVATDEAEYYFDVSQPVLVSSCFVYVDYQDETKRDSIEIHRVWLGWSRLYFYQYNRTNPTARHGTDAYVQINSMASYWNIISKNVDNFWRIRQEANPGLKVKIYGGRIDNPVLWDFDVPSISLAMADNAVSYIYFDDTDNSFKVSTTEPFMFFVLGRVTTASWDITEMLDYRSSYTGGWAPVEITEVQRDSLTSVRNWVHIYNITAGKLQFYSTGAWYDVPVTGGENQVPRLTEVIEWKARWANIDEMLAGMDIWDDGASLVAKPSLLKSLILDYPNFTVKSNYPLWEPIINLENSFTFKETAPTFANASNEWAVWNSASNTKISFPEIGTGVTWNALKLALSKAMNPSAGLRIRVETDVDGAQSWVLIDPNATKDIDPTTMTNTLDEAAGTYTSTWNLGTTRYWIRILVKKTKTITKVTKDSACTATRATISSADGQTILATANFSWNVATFLFPVTGGVYYNIEADSNGSGYTSRYWNNTGYPIVRTDIDIITGRQATSDQNTTANIASIETSPALEDFNALIWANITNAHWVWISVNETLQTAYKGMKFTLTANVGVVSITKVSWCTATKAYIYDLSWALLTTATFSSNVATFNYNSLVNGQSYYLMIGSDWSPYTSVKQSWASAYPYIWGRLNFIWWNIASVLTSLPVTSSIWSSWSNYYWWSYDVTFTVDTSCKLNSFASTYWINYGWVYAKLYQGAALLETSTNQWWTSNIFPWTTVLTPWNTYIIRVYAYISNANPYYAAQTLPIKLKNITVTAIWWLASGWYDNNFTINTTSLVLGTDDTNIYNIASILTNDLIIIPKWQRVHIVLWMVWDVVDAVNYYKVWYAATHTTTRKLNTYNWSSWNTPALKSDLFTGNIIDSSYWNNIVWDMIINNSLNTNKSVLWSWAIVEWANYVQSKNSISTGTISLGVDMSTSFWTTPGWYPSSSDLHCSMKLFWDVNNYAQIFSTGVDIIWSVTLKVVIWGVATYINTATYTAANVKIEYVKSSGAIKWFYRNWTAWVQIGTTQTNVFIWNPFIKLEQYWSAYTGYGWVLVNWYFNIDNMYLTNYIYSSLTPSAVWWAMFPYISSPLFHNVLLSLCNSDYAYKVAIYWAAAELKAVWQYPRVTTYWITNNFKNMTEWATQYLSNNPGWISWTAGTNSVTVGKARYTDKLAIKDLLA